MIARGEVNPVWLAPATAFILSVVLNAALRPVGRRLGLMDHPGGRKLHASPTPLVGGIAIYLAFLAAAGGLSVPRELPPEYHALLLAGLLIVIAGIIDDIWRLGIGLRFGAQIAVALIAVHFGGALIEDLGALVGPVPVTLGIWAVPFSVFALVGAINAINLSDGMDGLAGSLAAISLILSAIAVIPGDSVTQAIFPLTLAGGILGFLVFNLRYRPFHRARVFLGDSGSTFLGLAVGYFLIVPSQGECRSMTPVTALWLLGVPLLDTVACMILRVRHGRSPFQSDRRHLHYLLLDGGLTTTWTLPAIVALHAMLGVAGLLGYHGEVPESVMFLLFIGVFSLYLTGMVLGEKFITERR